MHRIFVTSDHHFSHKDFITFTNDDGELIRKFDSVEEMDELMIENWNRVVSENDKVYHLGDLCFSTFSLNSIMPRLNGRKVLVN